MPKAAVQQIQPAAEPRQKYERYAAIAASKLDLNNLDLEERAFLGTCQDLYRNERGCATPFETFVIKIIHWTTWGNSPKPEDLIDEIKNEFQEDFELTLHSIKRFMLNHPDAVAELQFPDAPLDPPATSETTALPTKPLAKAQRARKPRKKVAHA